MSDELRVGDTVRLIYGFLDQTGRGDYEIVRGMPAPVGGEVQYRVRGADGHERAIGANQTTAKDDDIG
jgi:hypothetical protein